MRGTKRPSFPVRRVLSRLRSGSSLPVVVDTDAGRFVAKLRGAAQGPSALAAEVVVGELAERLVARLHGVDGNFAAPDGARASKFPEMEASEPNTPIFLVIDSNESMH